MTAKKQKIETVRELATMSKQSYTEDEVRLMAKFSSVSPENRVVILIDPTEAEEKVFEQLKPKLRSDIIPIIIEGAETKL